MNAQTIQDIFIVAGMFFLRIGLPLIVVMGLGYLIQRWLEPKAVHEQFEGIVRSTHERAAASVTRQYALAGEAANKYAVCTTNLQTDIPCWLARQIAGQTLPEGCATCKVRTQINADAMDVKRAS